MGKPCPSQDFQGKPRNISNLPSNSRIGTLAAGCCAVVFLIGCASSPRPPEMPPQTTPHQVSMEEWMGQARIALAEGSQDKARAAYRAAAQSFPAEKLPWLKLAENYFNAQDYGNAVLAAQEALQRDSQDNFAHSVLAVSGLRITAGSLIGLRQEGAYPVGSRDEAITVARALRDTLGATSLLTSPQSTASRPKKSVMPRPPMPAGTVNVLPAVATPGSMARPSATAVPASNPFDKLK